MHQLQVAQRHICCTLCIIKSATSVMLGYCGINKNVYVSQIKSYFIKYLKSGIN